MKLLKTAFPPLFMLIGLLLVAFAGPLSAQQAHHTLAGPWEGYIEIQDSQLTIRTRFEQAGDTAWTGEIDIPQQGASGLSLVDITAAGDSVSFRFNAGTGMVLFDGTFSGDSLIAGTFHQAGMSYPFRLSRSADTEEEEPEPREPPPYRAEELTIKNGEMVIAGTLTLPGEGLPAPAVILVSGSGAQGRDVDIYGFELFRTIADHLTRGGIAVFRYDDRGVGGSTGNLAESSMEDLTSDLRAVLHRVRAHPEVNAERTGVMGHSQGGILAGRLASSGNPSPDFLVLVASPARPLSEVIAGQVRTLLEAQGASDSLIHRQIDLQRAIFDTLRNTGNLDSIRERLVREGLRELEELPDSLRPAVEDPRSYVSSQVDQQLRAVTSPAISTFLDYDPAGDLEKLDVPVLLLYGEQDTQVLLDPNRKPAAEALEEAGVPNKIEVIPGANHLFQKAKTGLPGEYAALEAKFAEGFLETLTTWIRKRSGEE